MLAHGGDESTGTKIRKTQCADSLHSTMRWLFAVLILASHLHGWGLRGHRVVGRIAENHLNSAARKMVEQLLAGSTLARVANEADHLRSRTAWACAAPLHYASVEDGEIYQSSRKSPKGDIVQALVYFETQLRDKETPLERRVLALKWLVHLVGDLHQPLHIGRSCDRGGNSVEVLWFDKKSNLHKVWDSEFINDEELSYTEYADFLDKEQAASGVAAGSYSDWADEAPIVRAEIYTCHGKDGCCAAGKGCRDDSKAFGSCDETQPFVPRLGYTYAEKNRKLMERQLYRAGLRLAAVLNAVADGSPSASEKLAQRIAAERKGKPDPVGQCVDAVTQKQ